MFLIILIFEPLQVGACDTCKLDEEYDSAATLPDDELLLCLFPVTDCCFSTTVCILLSSAELQLLHNCCKQTGFGEAPLPKQAFS